MIEFSFFFILSLIIIYIIFLFIVQYCWNNTISVISKTQEITLWETFLLLILFHILFNNTYFVNMCKEYN